MNDQFPFLRELYRNAGLILSIGLVILYKTFWLAEMRDFEILLSIIFLGTAIFSIPMAIYMDYQHKGEVTTFTSILITLLVGCLVYFEFFYDDTHNQYNDSAYSFEQSLSDEALGDWQDAYYDSLLNDYEIQKEEEYERLDEYEEQEREEEELLENSSNYETIE